MYMSVTFLNNVPVVCVRVSVVCVKAFHLYVYVVSSIVCN